MPLETSMPIGVKPVQQTKSTDNTQVVRREGGSAPFTPQTNVSFQNSVNDMAGVLMKIAAHQEGVVEAMPEQIKEMVENVLRQAFSLEATLGEGIGSTLESQRFSVDQLTTFARLLGQLSNIAEKNNLTDISSGVQTFMKCLREYLSQTDNSFEPVLLHKLSFQLLDAKETDEMSPELQLLLQPQNQGQISGNTIENGEGLAFLKQLLKAFLPTPVQSQETPSPENGQALTDKSTMKNMPEAEQNSLLPEQNKISEGNFVDQDNLWQKTDSKQFIPTGNNETGQNDVAPNKERMVAGQAEKSDIFSGNDREKSSLPDDKALFSRQANEGLGKAPVENGLQKAKAALEQVQNLRQQIAADRAITEQAANTTPKETLSEPLQNTPKTMDTMKDLANLLLKDATLTEEETMLLQKFVNGEQTVLTENDAKQLQLLLRLCESNVPASVRQAAKNNNMPDLPKLWAFMELCDLASLKEQTPRALRSASRHVADFATAMRGQMESEGTNNVQGERSMNFMMPLYLGENEKSYPAYIHVYDEEKQPEGEAKKSKETWLRICLLTENIGAVELTCRVYDKSKLDVRVIFSQSEAVQGFREYLPEFRASFRDSSLQLSDLKIGTVGARS